ncbi:MAG TPA: ABC transporter permease [Thermoanaerobaculia bacterium]
MAQLKLAFRTLSKNPFITAVAVLSLALGIGANSAIYSLFDQMLLAALPVQEPERLVNLVAPGPKPGSQSCNQAGDCDHVFSYATFRDLQQAESAFAGMAAHRAFGANLATGDRTLAGSGMLVSGSYFPLLGVRPALGRLISPADDEVPGQHDVVVLSHRFWKNELGGDPGVLNDTLVVNGRRLTVIGVAPAGFDGTTLGTRPDVFAPLSMRGALEAFFPERDFDNRRAYWAYVFARLAPGVSMERAAAEINGVYRPILAEVEAPLQEGMSEETMARFLAKEIVLEEGWRGQSSLHGEARTPLILLFAITAVVLLIACANIANLLLARGAARAQEMAVRNSLGAGRGRLLGQLLTESALLAVLGGAASLLVARWTLGLIGAILPEDAASNMRLELSPEVALFAGLLALGTGLLFGLYPALHATRPDLVTALKGSSGQPSGARAAARFRASLVTTQIALSMALLVAAGLFLKSLVNVSRVELGVEEEGLVTFSVAPALNGYEPAQSLALFERLEEELAAVPGVTGVSGALVAILSGNSWGGSVEVQGFESGPDIDNGSRYNAIGPRYFSTLGVPLLAGREFTESDVDGATKVAIVNEAFTEKFGLGERDAVGKWMNTQGEEELDTQIVGVVPDMKYNEVKGEVPPQYFTPYRQDFQLGFLTFYLRTGITPETVMAAVPGVVAGLDRNLPVNDLKTLEQQARENVYLDRMITALSAAFAVLATLLAAVGLYGVLAYTVAQRTREIGVRMALGAGRGRVRGMVLRQMARMLLVGGAIGILGALAAGRAARSLLFGLEGHDPLVVALGTVVLALVALAAGYLPAQRASQVDPMQALRYE